MNKERAEELVPVGALLEDTLVRVAQMKKMTNKECQEVVMTFAAMVILNSSQGDVKIMKTLIERSDNYAYRFKKRFISVCESAIKIFSEKGEDDDRREEDTSGD